MDRELTWNVGTAPEERRRLRTRMRERQVRRIKRRIRIGCVLAGLLIFLTGALYLKEALPLSGERTLGVHWEDAGLDGSFAVTDRRTEYLKELAALAGQDERYQRILDAQSEYPEKVLRLALRNEEALNFVLDYPSKKDTVPAGSVGEVTRGEVPLLLQWDRRWGYAPYGEESIVAVSGCGPACIAMAACALTGRDDITPAAVAEYSARSGFLTETNDTSWELMTYGCERYGITGKELGLDQAAMISHLDMGHPIIASVGPGDFTLAGHFIVITGYSGDNFTVNDPNSALRSRRQWSFERLADQIVNLWYYREL